MSRSVETRHGVSGSVPKEDQSKIHVHAATELAPQLKLLLALGQLALNPAFRQDIIRQLNGATTESGIDFSKLSPKLSALAQALVQYEESLPQASLAKDDLEVRVSGLTPLLSHDTKLILKSVLPIRTPR